MIRLKLVSRSRRPVLRSSTAEGGSKEADFIVDPNRSASSRRWLRNCVVLCAFLLASGVRAASDLGRLGASLSPDGPNLNLHWNSSPGQVQQIQVSADLIHWTNLPPVFLSAFTNSAWSDDGSLTG